MQANPNQTNEETRKCPEFVQQILDNLEINPKNKNPSPDKVIKTDSSSDEEETETPELTNKSMSPSKFYGKRVSFDYHNLKKIEKPIYRRTSVLEKLIESPSKKNKITMNLVKFEDKAEEIKSSEKKVVSSLEKNQPKTEKKSILKNTFFLDSFDIEKAFIDKKLYQGLIEKLKSLEDNTLIIEKLPNFYNEFIMKRFSEGVKDIIVSLLKVLIITNTPFFLFMFSRGLNLII